MLLFHWCVSHILLVNTRSLVSPEVEDSLKWVKKVSGLIKVSAITYLKRQWQRQGH